MKERAAPKAATDTAYVTETAQVIAARLPLAAVAFLIGLGGVWVIEHVVHPGRDGVYALVYALEVAVWLIGSVTVRRAVATHPRWCQPIALTCGLLQVALIAAY